MDSLQQRLLSAAERGDLEELSALITQGADVNFRGSDPDGETPLLRAVTAGRLESVEFLVAADADVNCAGKASGSTPLMLAREKPEIARRLLTAGANVNARMPARVQISPTSGARIRCGGETALHLAAAANNAAAIKILIEAGADIEAKAENGLAPLDFALKAGSANDASVALVEAGAKLTPQRLELMHAGAHAADSDLWEYPWMTESTAAKEANPISPPASNAEPWEGKCPACGSLIYSRRTRVCDKCGATLAGDEHAQTDYEQREWARNLAGKFSNRRDLDNQVEHATAAELLRRAAGDEPSRRFSPFWFRIACAMVAAGIVFAAFIWISDQLGMQNRIHPITVAIGVILVALSVLFPRRWRRWRR